MKIGRLAVVAFLSLARRNGRACVSDAMAGEQLGAQQPVTSQRLGALNAAWVARCVLLHLLRPPRVFAATARTRARLGCPVVALLPLGYLSALPPSVAPFHHP